MQRRSTPAAIIASLLVSLTFVPRASARGLASPLPLMLAIRDRGEQRPEWDWLLPGIARDEIGLTLRVRGELDEAMMERIEATGARLRRDPAGRPWQLGPLCAVVAPWSSVRPLAELPGVERVELARAPGLLPHLDVSVPEIGADRAWTRRDGFGRRVDGTGIVAADFDSGIDLFHPMFFHADGGVFDWIDVNEDGQFEPGLDAVDLDEDGEADPGETLALLEGALLHGGRGWIDGFYDTDVDWIFADTDGDGVRSYGPEAGYTDEDPSFGEPLFLAVDLDGDARLDVGERLLALGTSKFIATLLRPDTIRYRGVDLIETPYDTSDASHGTGVSSVLGGGWAGAGRRITGVAPGVELILVDFNNEMGLAASLPWALSLGAQVGSHPYGHKIFSFLDGSSNDELAIDLATTESNALQVVSVGNEAANRDDASAVVPAEDQVAVPFEVVRYEWQETPITLVAITLRWRRPEVRLNLRLVDPSERGAFLGGGSGSAMIGAARVDFSREDSPRGTAKMDLVLQSAGGIDVGEWVIEISSIDPEPTEVHLTMFNDVFRGGSGTSFTDDEQVDVMSTVSAYATADRAVGACSYGTRHSYRDEVIGQISGFSSRGPRIDGLRIVDICAPGDNDIIWASSAHGDRPLGGYAFGGGTSASAPHVAGSIALLRQAAPWATADELEDALYGAALVDDFVLAAGEAPNDTWGFGRVRVDAAIDLLPPEPAEAEPEPEETDRAPWERDLTPDAAPPRLPEPSAPEHGVEGGGCHCNAARREGFSGALASGVGRLVEIWH